MALLLFDGFEIAPALRNAMTGSTVNVLTGRDGIGKSVGLASSLLTIPLPTTAATLIVGFGWKPSNASFGNISSGDAALHMYGDAGATVHLTLNVSADGHLLLRRGAAGGTILATATPTISPDVWHYLEVKATIADAGGTGIVKLDGTTVINFTGDTKNAGTGTVFSTIALGRFGHATNNNYDDLVVLDGTGSAPYNDFIGERVVRGIRPTGAGATTTLTPLAGANWSCVDEDPWSPTVDYVSGTTGTDTYATADVSGLASVDAVQVAAYAIKTDSGASNIRTVMRSVGGTVVESADLPLSTTIAAYQGAIRQTDPDAATWTQALVNSAQFGVKVT